jgi:hypothetical protein
MASPTDFSPTVTLPGSIGIPAVAPLYVDGVPAASVIPAKPKPVDTQRFWSTQVRQAGDTTWENMVVTLAKKKTINYLFFEVPHFPHDLHVHYWDKGVWHRVHRKNGAPLTIRTTGSVPGLVNNPAALAAGLNPYHYGAGHWVKHDLDVQPFEGTKIRLAVVRHAVQPGNKSSFPHGPGGQLVPYPLGIRNLDFGLRLFAVDDFPWTPRSPDVVTERQPVASTDDVNGRPMLVSMRENRATDLLRGYPWRCAPQARADAVVNLYVDSRAADGSPQSIDRFYIDPVTSGPRLNLYYSTDPPPVTDFQALDDPILSPLVIYSGSQIPTVDADGLLFPDTPGWVTLSNQGAGASAGIPWWTALQIAPQFASTDTGSYMIADAGLIRLYYDDGVFTAQLAGTAGTGILAKWSFSFGAGDELSFAAGYDGSSFFAWCSSGTLVLVPAVTPVTSASVFRFGGDLAAETEMSPLAGNYLLKAFVLKQELLDVTSGVPQSLLDFFTGPGDYVAPSTGTSDSTVNAVARFHGSFVLGSINPGGFTGGLGSAYEACSWTPVTRDFQLARGYIEFEPVLASVFKFEFTSLQPTHIDYATPPVQPTKVFPDNLKTHPFISASAVIEPGMEVTQAVAPSVVFSDAPLPTLSPAAGASLPTEALYLTNPQAAAQLAQTAGSMFNFQPWQVDPSRVPRQPVKGPHTYHHLDIPVVSRIGYFVALSSLGMFAFDPTQATDTAQYVQTFGDSSVLDPVSLALAGAWAWRPGSLTSPPNITGHAQIQSKVLGSAHKVTGVQFATCQSPAVQLLDSPGFEDTTLQTWMATGDSLPLEIAEVSTQLGNMVKVTRLAHVYGWAYVMQEWPAWDVLQTQNPDWDDLQANNSSDAYGGMAYTGTPVATTEAGRLYAAARVFSEVPLTAPLALQLLDGQTGAVIAEQDQVVNGGTATEWFVGYTLGNAIPGTADWSTMEGTYATWAAILETGTLASQLAYWGFDDGLDGWQGYNATVATSSVWSASPPSSLEITYTSGSSWEGYSPLYPVTPGQLYGVTATIQTPAALVDVKVGIDWHDSGGSYLSSGTGVDIGTTTPGQQTTVTFAGEEAPAGAASVSVTVADNSAETAGVKLYVDDVALYLSSAPTWISIDVTQPPSGKTVTARLIQKTSTDDTWFVDDISVFEDALIWEFSNDGGASWWPAYDIRNNPNGVLLFPPPAQGQGNQLMWRLKGYRPGLNVTSLAIRPWYTVYPHGILPRTAGVGYGPNVSPLDHFGPIEADPRWKLPSSPIPSSWYFGIRQALGLQQPPSYPAPDTVPDGFTVGSGLVYSEAESTEPPVPTYSDFYIDTYIDTFAAADGGDVYTDVYCDIYGEDYLVTTGSVVAGAVHLTGTSSLGGPGTVIPRLVPELGAWVGNVAASNSAVSNFITLTTQPLAVRRVYLGNSIPVSLSASIVAGDVGVRRVSIDFQPDNTTTPAQLDAFLADCQANGLQAEISLWAGVNMASGSGTQWSIDGTVWYHRMLADYVPIIRRNGYTHVWVASNHTVVNNTATLDYWYPGDGLVDAIAPIFYCMGPCPGAGGETLAVMAAFADAHGKPFGLSEFAVDHTRFSQTQGKDFLGYILNLFAARVRAGKPTGDLIYYNGVSADALATGPASYVLLYKQISAAL